MSLEKALQDNTAAVEKLTAAIVQFAATANGAAAPTPAVKADTEEKAEEKPVKKAAAKAEKKEDPEEKYNAEVKPKVLELVKSKGREAVMAILAEFGADLKSAKDLAPGQYDDFVAKIQAAIDEDLA